MIGNFIFSRVDLHRRRRSVELPYPNQSHQRNPRVIPGVRTAAYFDLRRRMAIAVGCQTLKLEVSGLWQKSLSREVLEESRYITRGNVAQALGQTCPPI